ncbi:U-box domain-containing protein 7 [Linum grandiflorum]
MSNPPSSSSSASICSSLPYTKLQFFSRIRRFLRSKAGKLKPIAAPPIKETESKTESPETDSKTESPETEDDDSSSSAAAEGLQRSVKKLHFGKSWEEKESAAVDIARFAKEDVKTRKLIAELGVIPVLVTMVGSQVDSRRRAAVAALIELADGTYTNKALILEAGIFSKFPKRIDTVITEQSTVDEFSELIQSLSTLANTQFHLSPSEIVPFLVSTLESATSSSSAKQSCLSALHNLSSALENAVVLASNGVVLTVLNLVSTRDLAETALAVLGNLVVTANGKRAMEDDGSSSVVPGALIEALTWQDEPRCQELSAYVLMILAYQSSAQREKMAQCGIVAVLLEVGLCGSPLAQKRALKLLQWFRDERETKMGRPHSGPQTGRLGIGSPINPREAREGRKMIKDLVRQSLNKNLEMITRRASASSSSDSGGDNGGEGIKVKSLVVSTSSKSLPY